MKMTAEDIGRAHDHINSMETLLIRSGSIAWGWIFYPMPYPPPLFEFDPIHSLTR